MKHGTVEPTNIRQLRPKIDERLARAVMACLESDPTKRLASMQRFLEQIKDVSHEDGKSVPA
jgi:hypothetical protein